MRKTIILIQPIPTEEQDILIQKNRRKKMSILTQLYYE